MSTYCAPHMVHLGYNTSGLFLPQSNYEKKHQTKPNWGTFHPTSILQICQGHERQGKTDELTDLGNMATKCNVVFWIGSRNKRRILVEKKKTQTKNWSILWSIVLLVYVTSVNFLVLLIILQLFKILTLQNLGEGYTELSILFFKLS